MAWTAPMTAVTGALYTAAQYNANTRDNLLFLAQRNASATVAAAESTTSTSYTDLSTVGPAVTLNTGTKVHVQVAAEMNHNSVRHYMGVGVSGATTIAVDGGGASRLLWIGADGYADCTHTFGFYISGLTPGSNTFTCKYKSGTGTATFGLRTIEVVGQDAA